MKISLPACLAVASFVAVVACGSSKPPVIVEARGAECPTTGSRECRDATDCGPDIHCTGGRCFANQAGCPCSDTPDCGSGAHCTKGMCYANAANSPCTQPADCGSHAHCT